jgi:predicted phosphodiesterase
VDGLVIVFLYLYDKFDMILKSYTMRYLVLSDIHSNIEALTAAVRKARDAGYDRALCCGDVVGYGPNPAEVMDLLDELQTTTIRGNHDRVISGLDEPTHFNVAARQAVEWTRDKLPESYRQRLAALTVGPLEVTENARLVHGSARDEDEYVVTQNDAVVNLAPSGPSLTFFGHTHEPLLFTRTLKWSPTYEPDGSARLRIPADKVLVNPGSVGQPRDGDSRASFVIYDDKESLLEFYRAEYPVETTQARMRDAKLPEFLVTRLAYGR